MPASTSLLSQLPLDVHTHRTATPDGIYNLLVPTDPQELLALAPPATGYYSAGIHPCHLTAHSVRQQLLHLHTLLQNPRCIAVGEAGLDSRSPAPPALQEQLFGLQISLAEEHRLPLIIHCVRQVDRLLALKKQYRPQQPWVWHGFRGHPRQAEQLLRQGFYLALGEHYPAEVMRLIPTDRLLLETDESPIAFTQLLKQAANIRHTSPEELEEALRKNVRNLFFKGEEL